MTYRIDGLFFALTISLVFMTLKLTGVIDWSWWWVWSPLWITLLLALTVVGVVLLFVAAVFVLALCVASRDPMLWRVERKKKA